MISAAQQAAVPRSQTNYMVIPSDASRARIIARCTGYAALGWVIAEICYELLLGPHIRLLRSVALASGIGAVVGLLTSTLQWRVLRHYVQNAGWWVAATTFGHMFAGIFSGFLLYQAIQSVDLFRSTIPLQGVVCSGITGLVAGALQWLVLRNWVEPTVRREGWMRPVTIGSALSAPVAWLAGTVALTLLALLVGDGPWPLVVAGTYLTAGIAGSLVYRRFLHRAFHQVLPFPNPTTLPAPSAAPAPGELTSAEGS
ncbi:MAG: hypothetical protein ACJ78Q_01205 [Chloroflexia bacterium]